MPVQYSGIFEEHLATRQAAGLFDVSHMGVYDVRGADAASFLDTVCANDCGGLLPGESLYSHFLTPNASVLDDTLVYRRGQNDYLVVVNASNDDKVRTWLEGVRDGTLAIDIAKPWARTYGYNAEIRNLREAKAGKDMRVDIALQGPKSRDVLLALGVDDKTRANIMKLKRTELCDAKVGGFDLIVSRTGYTGEKMAFELFVHPERSVDLWNAIMKVGEPFGVKPIGLGACDLPSLARPDQEVREEEPREACEVALERWAVFGIGDQLGDGLALAQRRRLDRRRSLLRLDLHRVENGKLLGGEQRPELVR
jgi:glycine hydroxymethyltransferase